MTLGRREGFVRKVTLVEDRVPDFDAFPYTIPAVRQLGDLELHPDVTFLIGENGSGKSTLVEALAIQVGFNPEGGSKNFSFSVRPTESSLHEALRVTRGPRRERGGFFLRAESLFNVATAAEQLDLSGYGWEALHERSHGEAFLWLFRDYFGPNGLYILDEPEAALSPQRQLSLLRAIHELVLAGSQFVIATHSPILMAYPRSWLYELGPDGLDRVAYEDTEHYTITRSFLENPQRMLHHLLGDLDE